MAYRTAISVMVVVGTMIGAVEPTVLKANELISKLNLTEKSTLVTGKLSLTTGGCIGNVLPIPRVGFKGLCLQDGPNGVNLADLISVFPSGVTTGATWDKELIYQRAKAIGAEFRGKGINIGLGPAAGPLGRHALGGRNWEGFSVNPYLAGVAMQNSIRGQQENGVQACAKHVVGNEQETQRSNTFLPNGTRIEGISSNIDDRTLHELYLWPFADAAKAGVSSMMCSYNRLNQTYACENSHLLNDIIKKELGFQGYVISDWYATHSGAKSINSGLDLNMPGGYSVETVYSEPDTSYWGNNITTMIREGQITEERLDDMIRRILTPYYFLQQDTPQFPIVDPSLAYAFAAWSNALSYLPSPHPASRDVRGNHAKLIRKIAAEGTVLLKNVDNTLPLNKPLGIGVFGNDAADPSDSLVYTSSFEIGTLDIGAGAASARHSYLVSPIEAIKKRTQSDGIRLQYILHNTVLASGTFSGLYPIPEICLVFLKSYAGENTDRSGYELDWNSTLVIENVARICNNTVVVTHSPGVNIMPWASNPNVKAIIAAHYPGQESGNSIVDILWGDVNPSGKLPYSIPAKSTDYDIPIVNLTQDQVTSPEAWQDDFTEGQLVDYRHFDAYNITPLYEFGFGLSYTTFSLAQTSRVSRIVKRITPSPDATKAIQPGGNPDLWDPVLQVTTSVTNSGNVAGATVPQLYVSFPPRSVPPGTPVKVLRGFEKVRLGAGHSQKVTFQVLRRDLSYWNTTSQTWVIPQGNFVFRVGFSSRDIQSQVEYNVLQL
ncbi:glycosyl hydrolase family 3 N terminal domain-containing protein [Bisporella sp. PMI_857]|nr:glycosyl hydrolase family 3 N terminal domain-containing protein [Bisporella sp. PMI_857]